MLALNIVITLTGAFDAKLAGTAAVITKPDIRAKLRHAQQFTKVGRQNTCFGIGSTLFQQGL